MYHFSKEHMLCLDFRKYKQRITSKPNGLYYAVNDEWTNYLYGNNEYDGYLYKISISCEKTKLKVYDENDCYYDSNSSDDSYSLDKPDAYARVLLIDSYQDVINISDKYGCKNRSVIDWLDVEEDYVGIEIENYNEILLSRKNDPNKDNQRKTEWITAFDVNGGCIWNIKFVEVCGDSVC